MNQYEAEHKVNAGLLNHIKEAKARLDRPICRHDHEGNPHQGEKPRPMNRHGGAMSGQNKISQYICPVCGRTKTTREPYKPMGGR